ncbi:MAG: hypothetical protein HC901_03650 [Bdellovibrionaceae bacterium]|nr:hypothetical protein [Pseudobdellovibrionaceae bacterium]
MNQPIKEMPALTRLLDLEEVAAAFVYDGENHIVGAAVPEHYRRDTLKQIALRMNRVSALLDRAKVNLKEMRFLFEAHTVWMRKFGVDKTLVVFLLPGTDFQLIRQPINLAAINMENALSRMPEDEPTNYDTELVAAAHKAELELLKSGDGSAHDPLFQKLQSLCHFFLGPPGMEILEFSLREMRIHLPFKKKNDVLKSVEYCGKLIANVQLRNNFR